MRRFHLIRDEDVNGVSGTGIVAEGVEFHDGQCVISWFSRFHSVTVWPKLIDIIQVHGHEGKTRVEWIDAATSPIEPLRDHGEQ